MATIPKTRRKAAADATHLALVPAAAPQRPAPAPARPPRQTTLARADSAGAELTQAVLALLVSATPAPAPAPALAPTSPAIPSGPAGSAIVLVAGDAHQIVWRPGHACPPALRELAARHVDGLLRLAPDDDAALPVLLRLAQTSGHPLAVDDAVWPHLAAHRDARSRLARLEAAYPGGPASPALVHLLRAPMPSFQIEGALFAVVAGRALIADERGLGKSVMAIAAATLWQRHFGVQRVLVVCAAADLGAWQRAWRRFAPLGAALAQHMDGGLHQRQALWSQPAAVRLLTPEALASDAAHLAHWAPELVIVDEPQRLGLRAPHWAALATAPQALVLCGAPLAEQAALMHSLVAWLDPQRLGPLAALGALQAAAEQGRPLDEPEIERLSASLSRLMLQRSRSDVADQLPALVFSERLLPMSPGQRQAHEAALAQARQLLAGWQCSDYLADADQWRLVQALQALQQAALRAQPGLAGSALADTVVQALAAQLDDWAGTTAAPGAAPEGPTDPDDVAGFQALVLCPTEADREQLAARLALPRGVHLALPGSDWPAGLDAVVQLGVPWRTRRAPAGAQAAAGQQWLCLVAQDSLDCGLFDTLAQRQDLPYSLLDGGRGFLQGDRLQQWLIAVQAAVQAALPGVGAAASPNARPDASA